jgi:hypothetical protein
MEASRLLVIVASCALAVGCNKLFKHGGDAGTTTTAASAGGGSGGSGTPANTGGNATEPTAAPTKPPTSGCAWPTEGDHDITITKGCTVVAKDHLDIDNGATLTIEEGVKVSFDTDTYLWIRYGKLVIKGTAAAPVVFTSSNKSPAAGDWVGIGFEEKTMSGTSIDHLVLEYAGSKAANGEGGIKLEDMRQGGRISITNTTVRNGAQFGLVTSQNGTFAKFENNTFKDNKDGSVRAQADALGSFGHGNTFNQPIHVRQSELNQTTTWPAVDVPIIVDEHITVKSDHAVPTFTIADKSIVKFAQDQYISVAEGAPGAFVAKNVTFTSASPSPGPGDWAGVFLYQKASGTDIEGCTFEYFGSTASNSDGAITLDDTSAKDLRNVTIKNNTFRKGKLQAMHSQDGKCAPYDGENKVEGVPFCNKP